MTYALAPKMIPDHKLAPFERRLAAKAIDALVALCCTLPTVLMIGVTGASDGWALIGIFAAVAYLLLGDSMNGQSIGKRFCGLQVVDYRHGYPCKIWQSFLRNAAGFGWLRIFQLVEESDAIAAGTFTGQVVIDVRSPQASRTDSRSPEDQAAPPEPRAKIDFDGIRDFVRNKK